jgi:hypothetical protein
MRYQETIERIAHDLGFILLKMVMAAVIWMVIVSAITYNSTGADFIVWAVIIMAIMFVSVLLATCGIVTAIYA